MTRQLWIQIAVLSVIALTAFVVMALGYVRLPDLLFGTGHYRVTIELPEAAGLYERANVTYHGSDIGQVKDVRLTATGVEATLSLRSDVKIPADLTAEVHSVSAIGEQYVALLPRTANQPMLKNGDVIGIDRTSVPPDINELLDATNRGLQAIPGDNLKTVVDESYLAFGGLGPDINRFVKGSTKLAIDSKKYLPELLNVTDNIGPVLDTQTDTSSSVRAWAANLANITQQLKTHDGDLRGVLKDGAPAVDEVRQLFDEIKPTLPVLAANLASIAPVLVTYQPSLEQLLVLLPQGTAMMQAIGVPNRGTKQAYKGGYLSFNLNLNLPPPCTTGFLPVQQQRVPSYEDAPDRPEGDLYCRIPQDAPFNVRGARNIPCETRPGKRAPTVKLCESDENYVPLNDGLNWKGDPNATLSGQGIPQLPPGTSSPAEAIAAPPSPGAPPPPLAVAGYDPANGTYVGPDGRVYVQSDLAPNAKKDKTWQTMLLPPPGN